MHARYDEWIAHLFDHPVNNPAWHWDTNAPMFEASAHELVTLVEQTFMYSGRDLVPFTDAQVNQGVNFLASPACSDYLFSLKSSEVPISARTSAIRSIFSLYADCFQVRCSENLSHLDHWNRSALNQMCYMFWDITPLIFTEASDDEKALTDSVFSVLAATLKLPHLACQEAAIHGYGENHCFFPERVQEAMERFLLTDISTPELREYAENARIGCIL